MGNRSIFYWIKYWIRENWMLIVTISIVIGCLYMAMKGFASTDVQQWLKKPALNITCGDILIIAIVHAWISRNENKNK